jgi:hypothetical protein
MILEGGERTMLLEILFAIDTEPMYLQPVSAVVMTIDTPTELPLPDEPQEVFVTSTLGQGASDPGEVPSSTSETPTDAPVVSQRNAGVSQEETPPPPPAPVLPNVAPPPETVTITPPEQAPAEDTAH